MVLLRVTDCIWETLIFIAISISMLNSCYPPERSLDDLLLAKTEVTNHIRPSSDVYTETDIGQTSVSLRVRWVKC